MLKKILLIALAVVMCLALFACSDTAATSEPAAAESDTPTAEVGDTVAGTNKPLTMVSCDPFSAGYPEGWSNLPYTDIFAEEEGALDPNGLEFVKGTPADEYDALGMANVIITWNEPGTETMEMRDMYENVEDISMTIGGRDWTGFTGEFSGYKNIWLMCSDDEGLWQVSGLMGEESDESSYNPESEDFLAILESIEAN